ncbi:MAG: glycosyltransferase [Chloroflexia bacterium]
MSTALLISIIVPAYNAERTVERCLRALLGQYIECACEIILVDDGSTDATARLAEKFAPAVRLITQEHAGAAAARNRGLAEARGTIILFTDADCEPTPGWAATLVEAIRAGADGAKGTYRTRQRSLVARWVQAEYESKYRRMARLATIDFIDTYSAGYRREALEAVGGFDSKVVMVEDQELSFRMAARGYKLVFVPQAVVYHTHVSTVRDYVRRKFRIGYWKVLVMSRYPARIASDSHTPQSIKLEMALLGLLALTLPALPFSRRARQAAQAIAAILIAATLPLAWQTARKDLPVGLLAPVMIALRAAGLLSGTVAGLLRFGPSAARRAVSTITNARRIEYNVADDNRHPGAGGGSTQERPRPPARDREG